MRVVPLVSRLPSVVAQVLLQALPQGGQRLARRNAWASMTADAATARALRDAASAFAARSPVPGVEGSAARARVRTAR